MQGEMTDLNVGLTECFRHFTENQNVFNASFTVETQIEDFND
jgi:hypothetical protein